MQRVRGRRRRREQRCREMFAPEGDDEGEPTEVGGVLRAGLYHQRSYRSVSMMMTVLPDLANDRGGVQK